MASHTANLDAYGWAESGQIMAVCVCAVTGLEARDALAVVGAVDEPVEMTFAEAEATWAVDATPLQVDTIGATLILIEPNGWRCSDGRLVALLSGAGKAATVYWNVNSVMRFVHARDGGVVREFDPLLYESEGALPEEGGLSFGWPGKPREAAFLLLERLMGVRLELGWLTQTARETHWVDPDPAPRDHPGRRG